MFSGFPMPYLNGSMVDWAALRKLVLPALGAEEEGDSTARASGGARAADGHPKKKNRLDGFDCRRKPNGFPGSCVSVPHPGESESSFTGGGGISAQTAAAGSERRGCVQRLSSPEKMPGLQQPGGPPVPFRFSPHPHRASSLVLI